MNFKIIETNCKLPDVLVSRNRDEDDQEVVVIMAIGSQGEIQDYLVSEEVEFSESSSAKRFVRDFSVESANEWCKENNISY